MASYKSRTDPRSNIRSSLYLPNNEDVVMNNWTRSVKKDNPEREREFTLSRDSTPTFSGQARLHTPHTYPRTKQTVSSHMPNLDSLRHAILFDDETSGTENGDQLDIVSLHSEGSQSQDSGVQDSTPDSNQIVGRLMQIRDYLKQATSIKESLNKNSPNSQEQLSRLNKLVHHLGEQEEGYLALLQKMLADRKSGGEMLNNQRELNHASSAGLPNNYVLTNGEASNGADAATGYDSEVSFDVDGASEVSECTTELTWNAYNRPHIESHMGFHSDMSSLPNSTPTSSSGSASNPSTTLAVVGSGTISTLSDTLTRDQIVGVMPPSNSIGRQPTKAVQSNVDLFMKDEVDGSFTHHSISKSRSNPTTPRLKQTNLPIMNMANQPFDELMGVEFVEDVASSSDGFEVSVGQSVDDEQSDKETEVKALRKQRDLLKKMLDQQRMLKSLHERQAELLELQRRTDNAEELNNHKVVNTSAASSNGIPSASPKMNLISGGDSASSNVPVNGTSSRGDTNLTGRRRNNMPSDEDKDRDEKEEESDSGESSESETEGDESTVDGTCDEPPPTEEEGEEEGEVPAELQALRQKLLHLKTVFNEKLSQQQDDQQKLEALRKMQATVQREAMLDAISKADEVEMEEAQSDVSNPEREQLRLRLHELQDKKQKMELLLRDLQTLRQYRKHNGKRIDGLNADGDDDTSASTTTSVSTLGGGIIREEQELTQNAALTAGQAETVLDVMEQESKLRKLEEVRGRLDQLRNLVQYYQAGNEVGNANNDELGSEEDNNAISNIESDTAQDMSLIGNLVGGAAQSHNGRGSSNTQSVSMEDSSDVASNISLGEFGDDPEIQDKVKKLQSARERLARLQSLVSMVQQWPESAEVLPEDLAELAATAMDDTMSECSATSRASTTSGAQSFSNLYNQSRQRHPQSILSNQNASNNQLSNQQMKGERDDSSLPDSTTDSRAESEAFYLQRMEEQKEELHSLMLERNKLLSIQNELKSLHQQYTQSTPEDLGQLLTDRAGAEAAQPQDQRVSKGSTNNGGRAMPKSGVKFSTVLHTEEPSNAELYSRMMEQKMKRQESRKSRGDEDQMTADVTTLATWGDSDTSSSSSEDESSEEDEDTPNDEAEIDEDDDGYPSDGIMQVEEEEEANKDSDRDTYTIEDDYQLRQRYPQTMNSKSGRNRRPHTHKLKEAGKPAAGDYWKPSRKDRTASSLIAANQETSDAMAAHGSGTHMISKMKEQLDATTEMCQHLLQEQRRLQCQMRGDYSQTEPWQENRLIYSINQLFSQVTDMQSALKVTIDQVYAITQHLDSAGLESSQSTLRPDTSADALAGLPLWARPGGAWGPRPESRQGPRPAWEANSELRNKMNETGSGYGARTGRLERGGGDMTPTQTYPPQNSVRSDSSAATAPQSGRHYVGEHNYSIPPLDLDKLIRRRQEQSLSLQSTGRTYPSPSLSAIAAGRVRVPLETMYKPGVSSGICGTSYADNTSVSSTMSSVRGDSYRGSDSTPAATPTKPRSGARASSLSSATATPTREREESAASDYSLFEALRETIYSEVATLISQNENRPHFLIELFRELQMLSSDYLRQRGLYSIQELVTKFLTEDVSSLHAKMVTDTESEGEVLAPQPAWMLYRTAGSEETPTESCVTTDDDEVRQQMSAKQHHVTPVASVPNVAKLERVGSIKSDFADYIEQVETTSTHSTSQSQSGWEDPFNQDSLGDTVIHLDKTSSAHSRSGAQPPGGASYSNTSLTVTPFDWSAGSECSDLSHDIPFASNSPLGDTAIDLQEAMQKVKEIDRRKEVKREKRRANPDCSMSTDSSSSAQDACSEIDDSTAADIQMTAIDTQMLDRRIRMIMADVIPVLREHMDNVCSNQLLEYLQQRVISLTAQTGEQSSADKSVEFAQFFQKQLFNILKDSLAKFEGRRMRECGEEMLVDISEILFNELAFFKLMQDLDDPEVKDRIALNKWRMTDGPEVNNADEEDEEETDSSSVEGDNSTMDQTEDSEGLQDDDVEEEMEEEDLGKDRDDAFADEVNTGQQLMDRPVFKDIQFELAQSETKPMTRIGSDEDCSADDGDDTSELSTDDGDDTAISRQNAQDQAPVTNTKAEDEGLESHTDDMELKVEDLPVKLSVDMECVTTTKQTEEEKTELSVSAAVAELLPEGTDQLAGSGTELKPPTPPHVDIVDRSTEHSEEVKEQVESAETTDPCKDTQV